MKFISYRRQLLDKSLENHKNLMTGFVLDIGGKRERKRGSFSPPETQAKNWLYLNIDLETQPDIFGDAGNIPLPSMCVDTVICTEVLEHLQEPARCVDEVYRILKPGGVFIASVPFLYPIHADPYDFQRYTDEGLRYLCKQFDTVQINNMGGYWGVMGTFLEQAVNKWKSGFRPVRGVIKLCVKSVSRILYLLDQKINTIDAVYTTGYFVCCLKKKDSSND
jgi:SAM-dependent methyltransferase